VSCGFVVTEENWAIVEAGLDPDVDVAFVSHDSTFPAPLIDHHAPAVLVVEALPHFLTTDLVSSADQLGVVVAALITHVTGEQLAVDRGVGQVVRQPQDLRALITDGSLPRPSRSGNDRGLVVGVWGAHGSPGRTMISLAIAAIARARGLGAMVVDADPRGGTIATAWGLLDEVPGFLALCRTAQKGTLDHSQVRRLASRCDTRAGVIDVLTGVPRFLREEEVDRDSVDAVFRLLGEHYSLTIVDLGSDLPDSANPNPHSLTPAQALTGHTAGRVDHLIAVIAANPSGVIRFARAHDDLRAQMDHENVSYILNGVNHSRRALGDEAVLIEALWRFANLREYTMVPFDDEKARRASLAAAPLTDVGENQPILSALRPVVDQLEARIPQSIRRRPQSETPVTASKLPLISGWVEKVKKLAPLR